MSFLDQPAMTIGITSLVVEFDSCLTNDLACHLVDDFRGDTNKGPLTTVRVDCDIVLQSL